MNVDPEAALLSKVLDERSLQLAWAQGITVVFFTQEKWQRVWTWVNEYAVQHGTVPTYDAYIRNFPKHKLPDVSEESLSGLIEELREARRWAIVQEGMTEATSLLVHDEAPDLDGAVARLTQTLSSLHTEVVTLTDVTSEMFIGDIVLDAVNGERQDMLGISTGFATIDEVTGGLQPEQLITIVAPPKRAKSSIAIRMALAAQEASYVVALAGFEMSNREQQYRYVSLGAHVSLTGLQRSRLTDAEKVKAHKFEAQVLDWEADGGSLILIADPAGTTTVGGLRAKVEQWRPDLLIVDGAYLMDDELGEQKGSPQALTNITRGLKRLAQWGKIPVVVTTQALLWKMSARRGVQIDSIGYTSSFAQDSDVILGIDMPDPEMPTSLLLKVVAARNAPTATANIWVDYDQGIIEEHGYSPLAASAAAEEDYS